MTLLRDQDLAAAFDTADRFADRLRTAAFDRVRILPLPGRHTGITHTARRRPDAAPEDR